MRITRGGMRGGRGGKGGRGRGRGGSSGEKRKPKAPLPRGVKRRHLERVDNYEYSLPENYDDEDVNVKEAGGYDEWDNPSVSFFFFSDNKK